MYKSPKVITGLKARREAKGYTVTDLSKVAGVAYATVVRAEKGAKVHEDTYRWIEEALNG